MPKKKSKSTKTKKASIIKKATGQKKRLSKKKVVRKKQDVKKNSKVSSHSRKNIDVSKAFMTKTDAYEIIIMLVGLILVALLMISIS